MGELTSYTEWMQVEMLMRHSLSGAVVFLPPEPPLSLEEQVTRYQATIARLQRTNTELTARLTHCEDQICRMQAGYPVSMTPTTQAEVTAAVTDLEVCRVQVTASQTTIAHLERILGMYREQANPFEREARSKATSMCPIATKLQILSSQLNELIRMSDATLTSLVLRCSPLTTPLHTQITSLKQEWTEIHTQSEPLSQTDFDDVDIWVERVMVREDLLRKFELVKQQVVAEWQAWPLAGIYAGQREEAVLALTNVRISADTRGANSEDKSTLEDLEKVIRDLVQTEEPRQNRSLALQRHLLSLATLHNHILSSSLPASPNSCQSAASRDVCATSATEELQGSFQSFEYPDNRPQLVITPEDELLQNRLFSQLEQSERNLTILADLATSDPSPITYLTTIRLQAHNLHEMVTLTEEHQALTSQYLRDIPNLLITAGLLKTMLEEVKTLRGDLKEKLTQAKQTEALEDMGKWDDMETEASEALNSLFRTGGNGNKERILFTVHEKLTALIGRHREVQGAGYLPPDLSARTELEAIWKRLLTLVNDLVSLVTETYHKLSVDEVDTRAKLETLLEEKRPDLSDFHTFTSAFDYLKALVDSIREMIAQTDNLKDVIQDIRAVDSSLRQFELTMQENYYKLKPMVGVEDRKRERKRTFLTITHTEPLTPKEGITILTDIIAVLKKNANNLVEIESKRMQVMENSINVRRARDGLELLHEVVAAEQVLRLDSANQLGAVPGAGEEARQTALLAQGLGQKLPAIPPLSDSITAFLTEVLPWLQESLAYDQALNRLIRKAAQYLD